MIVGLYTFWKTLEETRSKRSSRYAWGYPFDWESRGGLTPSDTPLITTIPYVYEAFADVSDTDGDSRWRDVMLSIAEHVASDYAETTLKGGGRACSYIPRPQQLSEFVPVVNASAYRAGMLMDAGRRFDRDDYIRTAEDNLAFVLGMQREDGSWPYSVEEIFVDHIHTCFVLKALMKILLLGHREDCARAIRRGLDYYRDSLLDDRDLPKPFAVAPRMTTFRRDLYDYAEYLNIQALLL